MFKRFLISTWRQFKRSKSFSLLNIIGLAIGIACAGIILLWVEYYTTFNQSIKDLGRIYQMENAQSYGKDTYTFPVMPFGIREELINNFPGVERIVRYADAPVNITLEDRNFSEKGAYVDPEFLKMFSYDVIKGDLNKALSAPDGIAIAEKLAQDYFGDIHVLGKTLVIDKQPYQIKAVFKDPPENMEFANASVILPYSIYYNKYKQYDHWDSNVTGAWVLLKDGVSPATVNARLAGVSKSHNSESTDIYFMYPMERLALHGNFRGTQEGPGGKITTVKMFTLIAFIILMIACINFMNLSTARSEKRSKEIGLRKVMGSTRKGLILRLIAEAIIMSFGALLLGVLLMAVSLPFFNGLIGLHLSLGLLQINHILYLLGLGLFSGLLAGIYPAFYLSSFNPIAALKGNSLKAGGAGLIRKVLVVLQFSVSAIIIVAIFVIYQQIQHVSNRSLGFDKNNILYVSSSDKLSESFASLKQALLSSGEVASVSLGSNSPLNMYQNGGGLMWQGKEENQDVLVTYVYTDNNYLNTMNIQLASGRQFNANPAVDSNSVIINETMAKIMGKEGRIGGQLFYGNSSNGAMTIVGITKDFIYNNMTATKPAPLMFTNNPMGAGTVFMRLKDNGDLPASLSKLKSVFAKFDASQAFDYHFLDKDFEAKFKQQRFTGSLAILFGGLAVLISCLGLLGLSAYIAEQRTREIGIRKVLGASVGSVVKLLTREFVIMVLLSCIIAFPLAYYLMHHWLMDFAYRIDIHWYVFAFTALMTLFIAFVTVSFQAFKAGRLNPVKAIKSE